MSRKTITIVDYRLSNLYSVKRACAFAGINATVSSNGEDILSSDGIILPGVGAFNEAMTNLLALDLVGPLIDSANAGIPIFGICLGLQLLLSESEEFGKHKGLGLIPGHVRKFRSIERDGPRYKVPFIGWNRIQHTGFAHSESCPLHSLPNNEYMYFVHSFYAETEDMAHTASITEYGSTRYASSVQHKNLFATQFHPEKSGISGLEIYKNWARANSLDQNHEK